MNRFALVTLGIGIALAMAIRWFGYPVDEMLSWLIAITLVTFFTYGYDKFIAGTERTRVPEKVLLALAFAGGTLGALAGMQMFHHKTIKESFRIKFWLVILAQVVVIAGYFFWLNPRMGL